MSIDFYYIAGSPPCRAVMLTAKALGVELNMKFTNILAGDHKTPEFLKLNPQHVVPTIDDNGFALWESKAIMLYLFNKYGKDDSLYPKDPQKRAQVDRALYYEAGTYIPAWGAFFRPIIFENKPSDPEKEEKLKGCLSTLDGQLADQEFLTGDKLTLADLSLAAFVSTTQVISYDISSYANVTAWLGRMKALPYYQEANQDGIDQFISMIKERQAAK